MRTHAVARTMQVVVAAAPQHAARYGVYLRAVGTCRKLSHLQSYVSLEYQRVHQSLLLAHGSQRYGAGNVSGTAVVLGATVEQQQPLGAQFDVALGCRLIVYDGAVALIGSDGLKALLHIRRVFAAQRRELVVHAHFGHSALCHCRLYPLEQPHHRHAVAHHSPAEARCLSLVLHRFHQRYGRWRIDYLCAAGHVARHERSRLVAVHQYRVFEVLCQSFTYLIIWAQLHAIVVEILLDLVAHAVALRKQGGAPRCDEQIGYEHRVALYVGPAQIERPGYVVERRYQHAVGVYRCQPAPYRRQLVGSRCPCPFHRVLPYRFLR